MDEQQESLLKSDAHTDEPPRTLLSQREEHRRRTQSLHIYILYIINAFLLLGLVILAVSKKTSCVDPSLKTYSPANDAVEWEEKVFVDMPGQWSPYSGTPDDEKDELWDQLYTGTGFLLYDPQETKQMLNPTVAVPTPEGDAGIYGIEVFHELHCLNTLRKTIYQERFPSYTLWYPNGTKNHALELHHSHCIDRLRQGVQCAGNLGTHFMYWSEDAGHWKIDMQSTHTCRNFEKLQKWARARDYTGWDPFARSHMTGEV